MSYGEWMADEAEAMMGMMEGRAKYFAENKIWEAKDGRRLKFKEMSDRHLQNTINMLERSAFSELYESLITAMAEELEQRNGS